LTDLKISELWRLSSIAATSALTIAELTRGPGAAPDDPEDLRGLDGLIEVVDVGLLR